MQDLNPTASPMPSVHQRQWEDKYIYVEVIYINKAKVLFVSRIQALTRDRAMRQPGD